MTIFTYLLISCSQEKTSTPEVWQSSANIPAAVLRCRRCVAHGLCRSSFHSTRRKIRHHDVVLGKN